MLADIADRFPETDAAGKASDTSPMFRVFFDEILKRASLQELLVAAAVIIEKVDGESLKFINAMTVKQAEKLGLMPSQTPQTGSSHV
jgi:hypothetical protein